MLKWLMMMNADNCLSYVVTSIVLLEGILEKSVRKDVWRPTSQALIYVNVSLDIDIWIEGLFCFVLSKFRMTAEYFVYTTTLLNVSLYYRRKKEAYNKRRISLKLSEDLEDHNELENGVVYYVLPNHSKLCNTNQKRRIILVYTFAK